MNIKKHIPNALTCCNLLCGCIGILFTFYWRLDIAFYLVLTAAIFDFLDGFVARLLKVSSPIGKDLDSLADMVTFGVLPGFIMYKMMTFSLLKTLSENLPNDELMLFSFATNSSNTLLPLNISFLAFLIPIFSALRLAKFNNDSRQTDSFIGVNTPANTLLISSLGYILFKMIGSLDILENSNTWIRFIFNPYSLTILTVIMSFLLVSELPIFALKFKNFGWADNKIRYVFLIIALVLLILFQFFAFPFIILLYILLSVINNINTKKIINS